MVCTIFDARNEPRYGFGLIARWSILRVQYEYAG